MNLDYRLKSGIVVTGLLGLLFAFPASRTVQESPSIIQTTNQSNKNSEKKYSDTGLMTSPAVYNAADFQEIPGFHELKDYAIAQYLKTENPYDNPKYSHKYFGVIIFEGFIDEKKIVLTIDNNGDKSLNDYMLRMKVINSGTTHNPTGFQESETFLDYTVKGRLTGKRDSINVDSLDENVIESATWNGDQSYDLHHWKILRGDECANQDEYSLSGHICTDGIAEYRTSFNRKLVYQMTGIYKEGHEEILEMGKRAFSWGNRQYPYFLERIIENLTAEGIIPPSKIVKHFHLKD